MTPPGVHRAAAEGFGDAADAYARGRPGYPAAAVEHVVDLVRAGPDGPLVDLAAGTGIFTEALVGAGRRPIAAEPVAAMRDLIARSMPGVTVLAATAEAMPFATASIGAVTVAQAFHWFDGPRAIEELARIAKPGAPLVVVYNVRDDADPMQAALDDIWEPYRGDTPTHRSVAWRAAFDAQAWFTDPLRVSFPHEQVLDVEGLVDRVLSVSFIAIQPHAERARIAARVRSLAAGRSEIALPYRTDVWWSRRLG